MQQNPLNPKAIEVVVRPTKSKLECIVKIRHRLIGAEQKPAPDQWAYATQPNMKLVNLGNLHDAVHGRCHVGLKKAMRA
ncbi:MAG: hypothetical protein M3Y72_13950 [Acidobacteriota bacterium]|nr:hypothetical protein [Acidobacteriota bacterium]